MIEYLNIVTKVLAEGKPKQPTREGEKVEDGTIVVPNVHFSYDMQKGFPLVTTRRMPFKSMSVELEGFIKGITSKKWYQERRCKFWDEWANPETKVGMGVPLRLWPSSMWMNWNSGPGDPDGNLTPQQKRKKEHDRRQKECDDLGPIYGYQWRRFGEQYDEDDDGVIKGYDQLKAIVDKLENNPYDRRMVCSAWNPNQLTRMGLPPCHICWIVNVIGDTLNLHWTQRSCDLMYGVPNNIASYGLLAFLLANHAGLKVGNLSGMLVDCHIYNRQVEGAVAQIRRKPFPAPQIKIKTKNIFDWTYEDTELVEYEHHPGIRFGDIVV